MKDEQDSIKSVIVHKSRLCVSMKFKICDILTVLTAYLKRVLVSSIWDILRGL